MVHKQHRPGRATRVEVTPKRNHDEERLKATIRMEGGVVWVPGDLVGYLVKLICSSLKKDRVNVRSGKVEWGALLEGGGGSWHEGGTEGS